MGTRIERCAARNLVYARLLHILIITPSSSDILLNLVSTDPGVVHATNKGRGELSEAFYHPPHPPRGVAQL